MPMVEDPAISGARAVCLFAREPRRRCLENVLCDLNNPFDEQGVLQVRGGFCGRELPLRRRY